MNFAGDSFFTLGLPGRIGLVALSAILALGVALVADRLMRGHRVSHRLGIAVAIYALFVWLSPQIYYGYYHVLFDDLPTQWVIGWPPMIAMLRHPTVGMFDTLSALGQGALFWVLVAMTVRAPAAHARRC